nr:hypothetical protein [Hyphomonas sp. Mor2]
MVLKSAPWVFYAQVLSRALKDLEAACLAAPDSQEFTFYREEAPAVIEEAREALAALRRHVRDLESSQSGPPTPPTRH